MNQQRKTAEEPINRPGSDAPPRKSGLGAICQELFKPTSIAPLVYFRVLFGVICVCLIVKYHLRGQIKLFYVDPQFHFTYPGFDWVKPWPGDGMYWHFAALGLLGFFIAVGFCYRLSAFLFGLGYAQVFLIEQARYVNHHYLTFLLGFLMCVIPAHRAFSVDAWLRPKLKSLTAPTWAVWLLMFQLGIVYFFAGVAKLNGDWLNGASMSYLMWRETGVAAFDGFLQNKWTVIAFSYGGLLYDLLVVPFLLIRKTRWIAFIATCCFHATNLFLFKIGIFPWLMLGATFILFFSDYLPFPGENSTKREKKQTTNQDSEGFVWTGKRKLVLAALATYVAVHLLLPVRPWIHSGNSLWTDSGHYFSWRMMLRSKYGGLPQFVISYTKDGKRMRSRMPLPSDRHQSEEKQRLFWRSHWQLRKMIVNPDMVWQFCQINERLFRERGFSDIEIRGFVPVSLNGRPFQSLIDPKVNMVEAKRPLFGTPSWVLPLEQTVAKPRWEVEELIRLPDDD